VNKKLFVNSALLSVWNSLMLGLFGTGLVLTLITTSLGDTILSNWQFLSAVIAQGFFAATSVFGLLRNISIIKRENLIHKKNKLDAEITKRAAELIKEKEEK
jgi:hypothetical protein